MEIIEIKANENGSHNNQTWETSKIPEGYAVIPDCIEKPKSFPFVEITVEYAEGVATVKTMTAGTMPEPEPESEPVPTVSDLQAQLDSVDQTAVELYEANEAQASVNNQQDESLAEIYEMILGD